MMERRRRTKGIQEPAVDLYLSDSDIREIIQDGNAKLLVETAQRIGEVLHEKKLTASAIRSFLGMLRKIEVFARTKDGKLSEEAYRELIFLKPMLAYQAQRYRENHRSDALSTLQRVLVPAIDSIGRDLQAFRNFLKFFEAIIAYHKAAAGGWAEKEI